jgi:hypothetical protein
MNPLEELKQKLMVKPKVEDREQVAVIIKGDKKPTKKSVKIHEKKEEKLKEIVEVNPEEIVEENPEEIFEVKEIQDNPKLTIPIIVDETQKGFDRATILKKLKESKVSQVFVKPVIEISEEKKIVQPIEPFPKKAKKIVFEENPEEHDSSEEFVLKPKKKLKFVIEGDDEEENKEEEKNNNEIIEIVAPKKKERKTKKPEKGVAVLGPETIVEIGDTDLTKRLPKKTPPINIKVSSYYMNDREIFVNFINSLFEPYRLELQKNKENISCDTIGKTNTEFNLLTHQKIVRDYMNLYTPYRGLLLYHGLGSGKTATSIAIAEGMKDSKRIIIMTPASLRANYIEELKKAGDLLYKRNQFWEWISTVDNPETLDPMSAILNLPREYIHRHSGAWFINIKKKSNYDDLSDADKKSLEEQLNTLEKQLKSPTTGTPKTFVPKSI